MLGITNFGAFIIAAILLNLTPGADTMYILGRSISQGRRAGIYSALGISAGCFIHTMLAAFGLSIMIAQSPIAFNIIKYLGAIYLCFLGSKLLFSKPVSNFNLDTENNGNSFKKIFIAGIFTNVLNPKMALFFLAFLPQFVNPSQAQNPIPFLILGFTFIVTGTTWCLLLAFFSSIVADKIRHNYKTKLWLDRITGCVFVALGIRLAFQSQK